MKIVTKYNKINIIFALSQGNLELHRGKKSIEQIRQLLKELSDLGKPHLQKTTQSVTRAKWVIYKRRPKALPGLNGLMGSIESHIIT